MRSTKPSVFFGIAFVFAIAGPSWSQVPTTNEPFAITVHIASQNPADTSKRLERLMARANEHFGAANISFKIEQKHELPEEHNVLETIRERRSLRKFFEKKTINLFLVDELLDPNPSESTRRACKAQGRKPSGRLGGAHVPIKNRIPGTYIILSRRVDSLSLTHELGHFFGLPHHKDPENIMSYGSKRSHFDEKQLKTFRRFAKRFRRSKVVKTLMK